MIEVEIRGALDEVSYAKLKALLEQEGELIEQHEREMVMLRGYPGYDHNPITRKTDIRLRKTNGKLEIMVKQQASEHNVGRTELSLPLAGDWDTALQVLKALGFAEGNWMSRKKEVYRYHDIEWSLVEAPDRHLYYEAEIEASKGEDLSKIQAHLEEEAHLLGLSVLNPEQMRVFIHDLDDAVNKQITW